MISWGSLWGNGAGLNVNSDVVVGQNMHLAAFFVSDLKHSNCSIIHNEIIFCLVDMARPPGNE